MQKTLIDKDQNLLCSAYSKQNRRKLRRSWPLMGKNKGGRTDKRKGVNISKRPNSSYTREHRIGHIDGSVKERVPNVALWLAKSELSVWREGESIKDFDWGYILKKGRVCE